MAVSSPEKQQGIGRFVSWPYLPELLLVALTLAVFSPALRNGFIAAYDDELYVTMNSWVRGGLTGGGLRWAWTAFVAGNWHPLTLLSHMLDVQLFGLQPAGHHLTSLLWHAGSVLLFFRLVRSFGLTSSLAWSAALLFAIHPLRVESVVWVAERKDVLSVFFGLAALLAYGRYVRSRSVLRYLPVLLCYILSLMAKPMLVTLPLVMLLMDRYLFDRTGGSGWRRALLEKLPLLLLALAAARLAAVAQGAEQAAWSVPLTSSLPVAISAYAEYLRMLLLPTGLTFLYPLDTTMVSSLRIVLSLLVLAGVTVLLLRLKQNRLELLGWFWFLVTTLPVSGLIRFGGQFVADRYTYFSHMGLLIVAAALVARVPLESEGLSRLRVTAAVLIIGVLGALTVRQAGFWRNGETLYRRALALNPANWVALNNLGTLALRKARYGEAFMYQARALLLRGRPREALETLQVAYQEGGVPVAELDNLRDQIMNNLR